MKGMSFQNGVEFKVAIDGESWTQGGVISGKIESKPVAKCQVWLAEGTDKKVKLKAADAFVVLGETTPKEGPLDWRFELPIDAPITDKFGGLYILYGHGEYLEKLGQLRLNILPHLHLRDLIDLMSAHFRFAVKSISAGKAGATDVKLDPPGNKDWAMLEQLVLQLKISNNSLEAKFIFHRKEVDATKGGLATKNVKRELKREWNIPQIILDFNQRLDKEILSVEIEKLFAEYRDAGWLGS